MINFGTFPASSIIYLPWSTNAQSGASITRGTDGTIRIYKDDSLAQRTSSVGITDNEDFDGIVGTHLLKIDLSDNTDAGFYVAGSSYSVMLVAAAIDSQTVNAWIGRFSIGFAQVDVRQWNGTAVATPATAGIPDVNVKNIDNDAASASGTVTFPNATLASTTGAVGSVTGAVGSVTGNVAGNVTGSVGSVVGAVGSVTGSVGGNVTGSVGSVVGAVGSVSGAVGSVSGNVGGNVTGSVGSVAAGGITAASIATDAIDDDALSANAITAIQANLATAAELLKVVAAVYNTLTSNGSNALTLSNGAIQTFDDNGNRTLS